VDSTDVRARLEAYRLQQKEMAWTGTFDQYLEMAIKNPHVAQLAHARIYDMIMEEGVEEGPDGQPRYKFFAKGLFGLEKPVAQIVEYFSAAAKRLDPRKRILLLMGPVGGGKSTIAILLREGLERYTRTARGALYGIKGCPMREEPLHLIPKEMRADLQRDFGLYIEGTLCPSCAHILRERYDGDIYRMPVERVVFSAETRVGLGTFVPSDPKCVTGDTLLLTSLGMVRFDEIQQAVQAGDDQFVPFVVDVSGQAGREATSHFYNGGLRPTRRLRTRLGYELEGSLVHPVLVMRAGQEEWVRLADVRLGDHVALQRGSRLFGSSTILPEFADIGPASRGQNTRLTLPTVLDADLARLLGYIVAEGSLTDTALWITNGDKRVLEDIHTICERLFGIRAKDYGKVGTHARSLSIYSMRLVRWLEGVCGITCGAANKCMPRVIRAAPQPLILAFLEGLFWGDGTISARHASVSNRFKYASASRELAIQVQTTLLNMGIVSALYKETIQSRFIAYSVVVLGDGVVDLLALIPGLRAKCTEDPTNLLDRRGRSNFDYLPGLQAQVRTVLTCVPYGERAPFARYNRYAMTTPSGRDMTYTALAGMLTAVRPFLPEPPPPAVGLLERHLDQSHLWLEVREIEEGEEQVYDLTVPGTHSFCANGFINHNSQDVSELVGSIDLSTIGEVGVESDPRAYRFDGELNVANRGLIELIEMLKADEKLLYVLLTLSQEQNIKTGRFSLVYADEVILGHTNENEYKTFVGNPKSEALQDRIILVRVPYNLRVSEEERIYEKLLAQSNVSGVHIAPHTLRVASMFANLSRLEPSKKASMSLVKKMKLYDGEEVEGYKTKDVRELQEEATREGMDGISPRYIIDRLSNALIRQGATCINPINALRALRDGFDQHTAFSKEERDRYMNLLADARREYDEMAKREVQRAFVYAFEDSARTLLNNYLDNVEAFCRKEKIKDPLTDEPVEPDEKLMRSIEEQTGVTENGKQTFRESILMAMASLARRGKTFEYTSDERLKEAIERKLFADLKDVIKITTSIKTPDAEQLRRMNEVVDRLMSEHGYCAVCARDLLGYVGTLLNR